MPQSHWEVLVIRALKSVLPSIYWHENVRPTWLKYPPTGRNLELDLFNGAYRVAIETNGFQHFRSVAGMASPEQANYQITKDTWKRHRCAERGIQLFYADIGTLADMNRLYQLYCDIYVLLPATPGRPLLPRYQFEQLPDIQAVVKEATRLHHRKVKPWHEKSPKRPWWKFWG